MLCRSNRYARACTRRWKGGRVRFSGSRAGRSLDAGDVRRRARSEVRRFRQSDVSASSIHDGKAAVGPFGRQVMRGGVLMVGGHRDSASEVPRRTSRAAPRAATRVERDITTRCCCQRDTVSSWGTLRRLALQQTATRYAAGSDRLGRSILGLNAPHGLRSRFGALCLARLAMAQ